MNSLKDMEERLIKLKEKILTTNKTWIRDGLSFEYNILEAKILGYEMGYEDALSEEVIENGN